jgi:hypothetical protein
VKGYNLEADLSREAVFSPGRITPFEVWQSRWSTELKSAHPELIGWWAANLCHASYCTVDKLKVLLEGRGELLEVFQHRTQFAYAVRINDVIFLVFQGSAGGEDALLDLTFLPKRQSGILVHKGFVKALDYLWTPIEKFILNNSDSTIYYCGHSLGGGMAQLAAMRKAPAAIYTFGSPRVGFSGFKKMQNVPHWRFVNCTDIVTVLPPFIFGYQHTGNLVFIDMYQGVNFKSTCLGRLNYKIQASLSYWLKFKWFSWRNAFLRSLVDHAPVNYCRALSRHLLCEELEKK